MSNVKFYFHYPRNNGKSTLDLDKLSKIIDTWPKKPYLIYPRRNGRSQMKTIIKIMESRR